MEVRVLDSSAAVPPLTERDDGGLIAAVRNGDTEAYGELFVRHVDAARRLARSLTDASEAEDLVSEGFARVLAVLQRGDGPDLAFRPYLLTAVRHLHVDRSRAAARIRPTDDVEAHDPGQPFVDTAVIGYETSAAARAMASLPERWQAVLWHTEVEGQKPAEIAPLLGMTPNAVAALAYRAREGLRQAFVTMHVEDAGADACATARANLGAYVRDGLSHRDARRVAEHLQGCRPCTAIYLELVQVNGELRGVLAPLVLGSAAAAYLGGLAPGHTTAALGGMIKSLATTSAAASVVAVGLVLGVGSFDPVGPPWAKDGTHAQPQSVRPRPATLQRAFVPAPVRPTPDPGESPAGQPDQPSQPDQPPNEATEPTGAAAPSPGQPTPNSPGSADRPRPGVSVSAITSTRAGLEWEVQVRVAGLLPGASATLTVEADQPTVLLVADPSCDVASAGRATCALQGPSTVQLVALPQPSSRTTLTISVTPGPGVVDNDPGDNVVRVTLAP